MFESPLVLLLNVDMALSCCGATMEGVEVIAVESELEDEDL